MKIITNSTSTQAIGIGDETASVSLQIHQVEDGYVLSIRTSNMYLPEFETAESLEGIQAKAATILEALAE